METRAATAAVAIVLALGLAACKEVETEEHAGYEPAKLESLGGDGDAKRVTFTAEAVRRTGLKTATVRRHGAQSVVPYAALIYDPEGRTYVYASPEPLSFVRKEVEVDRIGGRSVFLSKAPPAGTAVVTVGAAEVYGTELEVASH